MPRLFFLEGGGGTALKKICTIAYLSKYKCKQPCIHISIRIATYIPFYVGKSILNLLILLVPLMHSLYSQIIRRNETST